MNNPICDKCNKEIQPHYEQDGVTYRVALIPRYRVMSSLIVPTKIGLFGNIEPIIDVTYIHPECEDK